MNSILKWLNENDIKYQHTNKGTDQYIKIVLEPNCTWFNGFGQEMVFAKYISIHKDTYKNYTVSECIGYNRFETIVKSTKQENIIKALQKRL